MSFLTNFWNVVNSRYRIGDEIKFGTYPRNNPATKEPLIWRVLDVANGKVLLITKECIVGKNFDERERPCSWADSDLRKWLNKEFYNSAFSESEKSKIILSNIDNSQDVFKSNFEILPNTTDNVFILSCQEAEYYFRNNEDRQAKATKYAAETGADFDCLQSRGRWWLRTTCPMMSSAHCVLFLGGVSHITYAVNDGDGSVRPSIWINVI